MLAHFPRFTIFAHRGSSAHAPENTLSAFELAIQQDADAIEFDVQLSADGQVVVIHDASVNRTTDGSGRVRAMPLAALKQLDAGAYFDGAFRGERIPTLEEVLEAVGSRILMNIELKPDLSSLSTLPAKVAQIVKRQRMQRRILFSSFDPIALWQIKKLLPNTPCGLLALPGAAGWVMRAWGRKALSCQALHPHYSSVNAALLDAVHQSKQRLHVYTVNDPAAMKRLFLLGVDGIFTDDPALAVKTRKDLSILRSA